VFLDILRGIAVLLVLGRHMAAPAPDVTGPIKGLATLWIQIGWTGVDLFFVLSGFLVSGLLFTEYQRHGTVEVVRFLIRRGFKIYPGFYFMILVTVLLLVIQGEFHTSTIAHLLAEAFYVQSYLPGLWNHTWSLAVEEHFYFLLAASVYLVVSRRGREPHPDPFRRFLRVTILIVLAIATGRSLTPHVAFYLYGINLNATELRLETHARIDTLIVGVILSYLYHFHRRRFSAIARERRMVILITSAVLLVPPFIWPVGQSGVMPSIGLLCIALGFAGALTTGLAFTGAIPARGAARALSAPLAFVGFHSYSIYLWHMPVQLLLMPFLAAAVVPPAAPPAGRFLITTALYIFAALFVGAGVGKIIEQPALALRDRLFPTRAGILTASSEAADVQHVWRPLASELSTSSSFLARPKDRL
jgi:peptidoglycan/LPS O-acetylase OafA/YrhL